MENQLSFIINRFLQCYLHIAVPYMHESVSGLSLLFVYFSIKVHTMLRQPSYKAWYLVGQYGYLIFPSQECFGYTWPFGNPYKIWDLLFKVYTQLVGNMGITLDLFIYLEKIDIYNVQFSYLWIYDILALVYNFFIICVSL